MKANEAPEKLYISDSELNDAEHCIIWFKSQQNNNDIEYIRVDAFVEKACKWFRKIDYDDNEPPYETTEEFIEGFKKAMKGE
jgi:hypothetical protein